MYKKFIAYYRVSTKDQGISGLGLEAQKTRVTNHLRGLQEIGALCEEYVEVESGKKNARPELTKALKRCKELGATLVVATLDRISRNAVFLMQLHESKQPFTCVDTPLLDTVSLGLYAVLAQNEAEKISERTKRALAEKKRQGYKLGSPQNLTKEAGLKGSKSRTSKALSFNREAYNLSRCLREQKLSYSKIAEKLKEYGFKTSRGNDYTVASIQQMLKLYQRNKGGA